MLEMHQTNIMFSSKKIKIQTNVDLSMTEMGQNNRRWSLIEIHVSKAHQKMSHHRVRTN